MDKVISGYSLPLIVKKDLLQNENLACDQIKYERFLVNQLRLRDVKLELRIQ
jgi:hypothetical protein